ncbi:adenylate/guanylate cyclase domain-containing protein [uncultured Cocleimonas sp.]|uniref:CHASE2 domain-containing protein n=1 Tax=uncultured Cocleimonas sp. TaxID=1051587 RepID=UPI0034575F7A
MIFEGNKLFSKHKQSLLPIITGIVLTILAALFYLSDDPTSIDIQQRLEAIPYDIRLKLSTPIEITELPPIIIIDIDEASIKKDGRWPWERKKIGTLVNKLHENNVAVIAMDVVQSEKEQNPLEKVKIALNQTGEELPDWYLKIENNLNGDSFFADSIKDKEVVLGYPFHRKLVTQSGKLASSAIVSDIENTEKLTAIHMLGYTANLNEFTNNSAGSGFFSIAPDRDGTIRRAPVVAVYNNQIYPSLALETARIYLLEDEIKLHTDFVGSAQTITHLSMGKMVIKTDAQGQILIPYLGKQKHFPYIPASEILHNKKTFPELENAIALVGTSAVGLSDLRPTPVQASFPGVEIQANILHGLLHPENIAYVPDWAAGATVMTLAVLSLFMALFYPLLQPMGLVISGTALVFVMFGFNYWMWSSHHINLPLIIPLLTVMAVSSIHVIYDLIKENKGRRRIHDMFGQYVPLEHINKLIEFPHAVNTDGEKREMTVLFSDIRDFTALSEPLTTRQLKTFLNQYLTPITEIIFNNQGTIDKYVGDMVMAFWGAPIYHPQHATKAVIAAMEMQQKIKKMQKTFKEMGINNIAAGIGIHTGEMNVGDMGSDYRRAYTVLGDAVNLGSRLEGLTKYYGVGILVSEETKLQCPDIVFRYIDNVRVKGKQDSIKIYEPLKTVSQLTELQKSQLENHEQTFAEYLSGKWETAHAGFRQLYETSNDPLYRVYLERTETILKEQPTDWDPIHNHTEK